MGLPLERAQAPPRTPATYGSHCEPSHRGRSHLGGGHVTGSENLHGGSGGPRTLRQVRRTADPSATWALRSNVTNRAWCRSAGRLFLNLLGQTPANLSPVPAAAPSKLHRDAAGQTPTWPARR